jgi:hypothetical protein
VWYNCYTKACGRNSILPKAGSFEKILSAESAFEEAEAIFRQIYYEDLRRDDPEQHRVIGWVNGILNSLIYEPRVDAEGEYYYLVTLWKSTKEEQDLYAKSS